MLPNTTSRTFHIVKIMSRNKETGQNRLSICGRGDGRRVLWVKTSIGHHFFGDATTMVTQIIDLMTNYIFVSVSYEVNPLSRY